ncbi:MAG: transposase [Conexibacter sp.]|nr:transposase [Conexibacter sp.]
MDRQIEQLTGRVEKLERQLARTSRNSSLPPSQDPPGAPPRAKGRSPRRQGGQPGHEGKGRGLLPAWAVDEIVEHWPDRCGCGHVFGEAERRNLGLLCGSRKHDRDDQAAAVARHDRQGPVVHGRDPRDQRQPSP